MITTKGYFYIVTLRIMGTRIESQTGVHYSKTLTKYILFQEILSKVCFTAGITDSSYAIEFYHCEENQC